MFFTTVAILIALTLVYHQVSNWRKRQHAEKLSNQFVEALESIVSALKAGASFVNALQMIQKELEEPLRSEIDGVLLDYRMGRPLEEGLEKLAERHPTEEFQCFLACIKMAQASGGSLASVLTRLTLGLREKRQLVQRAKALASQGHLQAYVMSALPIFIFLTIRWFDPYLMESFMQEGLGKHLLGAVFLGQALAFWSMQKIMEIDL